MGRYHLKLRLCSACPMSQSSAKTRHPKDASITVGESSPSFLISIFHPKIAFSDPLAASPWFLLPTLFFEPDDLGVGAEAVPSSAVVNGLEIGPHDVADGQCGDDTLIRAHRLHCVAPGGPRLQDVLLPGPSLPRKRGVNPGKGLPHIGRPKLHKTPIMCPMGATHDSVGRRGAADEALDLPFLAVEGVLRLGAGNDGWPCKERRGRLASHTGDRDTKGHWGLSLRGRDGGRAPTALLFAPFLQTRPKSTSTNPIFGVGW